jgi:capsular exopolysaccharide synthesis family protein
MVAEREDINFKEYFRIISMRKWMIILPVVILTLLMGIGSAIQTPYYKATVTLLIEKQEPEIVDIKEVLNPDTKTGDYYETQYKLLTSRSIAEKVVDALGLDKRSPSSKKEDPLIKWIIKTLIRLPRTSLQGLKGLIKNALGVEEGKGYRKPYRLRVIEKVQKSIEVEPVPDTRLVKVSVWSDNPVAAAKMVNTLAEVYIQNNLEIRLNAARQAVSWLSKEEARLRKEVEEAELALQNFKEERKIVGLEEKANIVVQKLAELNSKYTEARTQRLEMETRINELKKLSNKSFSKESFPDVINNPLIKALKEDYVKLETEYSRLSRLYKPKHPKMVQLRSQKRELSARINTEVQKIINSIYAEYNVLLAREKALKEALEEQKKEALQLNRDEITYGALKREVDSKKQLYDIISSRLKETNITKGLETNNIKVIDEAVIPTRPEIPKTKRNIFLGLILGLALGFGFAFLSEHLDDRLKNPDDVERLLGLTFLGFIPAYKETNSINKQRLTLLDDLEPAFADSYGNLMVFIQFFANSKGLRTLLVTSAMPGEGKSTTVSNLAISFAKIGKRVFLIDADLRRPTINEIFEVDNSIGLSEVLKGLQHWSSAIKDTTIENLKIMPSGAVPRNSTELIGSQKMKDLIREVKDNFDIVLIDSPITVSTPDTPILASLTDGVLLVYSPSQCPGGMLKQAKKLLTNSKANLVGVAFNKVNIKKEGYYYHQYYYYDYRSEKEKKSARAISGKGKEKDIIYKNKIYSKKDLEIDQTPTRLMETTGTSDILISINKNGLTKKIGSIDLQDGESFLILDVTLSNRSNSSIVFDPEASFISSSDKGNNMGYGAAITKLYSAEKNGAFKIENGIYPFDYEATNQSPLGISKKKEIQAQATDKGLLTYRIKDGHRTLLFNYHTQRQKITIPFNII